MNHITERDYRPVKTEYKCIEGIMGFWSIVDATTEYKEIQTMINEYNLKDNYPTIVETIHFPFLKNGVPMETMFLIKKCYQRIVPE